jgi:hypothetical protein
MLAPLTTETVVLDGGRCCPSFPDLFIVSSFAELADFSDRAGKTG